MAASLQLYVTGLLSVESSPAALTSFFACYKALNATHSILDKWGPKEVSRAIFHNQLKGPRARQSGNYITVKGNHAKFYKSKRTRCVRCATARISSKIASSNTPMCHKCSVPQPVASNGGATPTAASSVAAPVSAAAAPTAGRTTPAVARPVKTRHRHSKTCDLCGGSKNSAAHRRTDKHKRNVAAASGTATTKQSVPDETATTKQSVPDETAAAAQSEPDETAATAQSEPDNTAATKQSEPDDTAATKQSEPDETAPNETAAAAATSALDSGDDRRKHPWGRDCKWPAGRAPINITGKNQFAIKIRANGKAHEVRCLRVDGIPNFLAKDACVMMGSDLCHRGHPNPKNIRTKLPYNDDLGTIMTRQRAGLSVRQTSSSDEVLYKQSRSHLYLSLRGFLIYVVRTKMRSTVSVDLTRWASDVLASVLETGYYVQPDGEKLPLLLRAIREGADNIACVDPSAEQARVMRTMPPPPITQEAQLDDDTVTIRHMCRMNNQKDLSGLRTEFLRQSTGTMEKQAPVFLMITGAITSLVNAVKAGKFRHYDYMQTMNVLEKVIDTVRDNTVPSFVANMRDVIVRGVRGRFESLPRKFFTAAMTGQLCVRAGKPFLTNEPKPNYNPENDLSEPKSEVNDDFVAAVVNDVSGDSNVVYLDADTGNTTKRLCAARVAVGRLHVPNPDPNICQVLASKYGIQAHAQSLGDFAMTTATGGAKIGAFWADFCGGSRKYLPEVGKLLASGMLHMDQPVVAAVTFHINETRSTHVDDLLTTLDNTERLFKDSGWCCTRNKTKRYKNGPGQLTMVYLRYSLRRA